MYYLHISAVKGMVFLDALMLLCKPENLPAEKVTFHHYKQKYVKASPNKLLKWLY